MSTDSPSRVIECVDGASPDFELEFDPSDRDNLKRYCDELAHYRRQTSFNPMHPGLAFDVTIDSRKPTSGPLYRPLPLFALEGGDFRLVITFGIQNEVDRLSQVWVADVRRKQNPEVSCGCILLKLFQGSLLPHPEPTWADPLSEYECPRTLAGTENLAYTTLEDLQGWVIPYYYGKHKFIMPNGESTRVILLEYIEGSTLAELKDKYPSHSCPEEQPLPEESYTEWLEIAKELYVPALRGMSAIADRKVVHQDLRTQNIMITSTSPRQVVYIDFGFSAFRVPEDLLSVHKNCHRSVTLLTGCCCRHSKDFQDWAKTNLPGGLMYPTGDR